MKYDVLILFSKLYLRYYKMDAAQSARVKRMEEKRKQGKKEEKTGKEKLEILKNKSGKQKIKEAFVKLLDGKESERWELANYCESKLEDFDILNLPILVKAIDYYGQYYISRDGINDDNFNNDTLKEYINVENYDEMFRYLRLLYDNNF